MPNSSPLHRDGESWLLEVYAAPKAHKSRVVGLHGDRLKIQLAAPPVDGAANVELIRFLSKTLDIPKSQLELTRGMTDRRKAVRILASPGGFAEENTREKLGLTLHEI